MLRPTKMPSAARGTRTRKQRRMRDRSICCEPVDQPIGLQSLLAKGGILRVIDPTSGVRSIGLQKPSVLLFVFFRLFIASMGSAQAYLPSDRKVQVEDVAPGGVARECRSENQGREHPVIPRLCLTGMPNYVALHSTRFQQSIITRLLPKPCLSKSPCPFAHG